MNGPLKRRVLLPLALFALSLSLYLVTMAPTITWRHDGYDAGDLITAAYTLGIPHPTGYPTYMLLGKLMTLLPVGDIAYRMNLLSAWTAALAVSLLYLAARITLPRQPEAIWASGVAALCLATSRIFWSQALITEVYAFNALLFAVLLLLCLRFNQQVLDSHIKSAPHQRLLRTAALIAWVYGLSLGNHLTIAFSAPLLLWHGWQVYKRRLLNVRQWAVVATAFALGLAVYAYLPLRAGREPLLNWGDPRTLRGLLWVVSGGIYRPFVLALPLAQWPARLLAWAGLLRQQFGIVGTVLGLLGIWAHARRNAGQAGIFLLTFFLYSLYAAGYNTTDSYVYLLPVYILFALWIGHGAAFLLEGLSQTRAVMVALSAALLLVPIATLRANWPAVDLHNDRSAYEYGTRVLAQVPDRAIVISATDPHTFTLWYFARVVVNRPLVAVVDRDLLVYDWYVAGLRRRYPWLRWPTTSPAATPSLEQWVEANRQDYALFLADADDQLMARYSFEQQGLLYRLQSEPTLSP
jgi:hypothetical protein